MKQCLALVLFITCQIVFQAAQAANTTINYALFYKPFKPEMLFLCRKYGCKFISKQDDDLAFWLVNDGTKGTRILIGRPGSIKYVVLMIDTKNSMVPNSDINEQFNKLFGVKRNWLSSPSCNSTKQSKAVEIVDRINFICNEVDYNGETHKWIEAIVL